MMKNKPWPEKDQDKKANVRSFLLTGLMVTGNMALTCET
jgi:hypothetical protein